MRSKVLRQCREQRVPALVAGRRWLSLQQGWLNVVRPPAILLHELPHKLPPHLAVSHPRQVAGQINQSHRAIDDHCESSVAGESFDRACGPVLLRSGTATRQP
jgi:hypothetical protein